MVSASPFAIVCLRPPVDLVGIRRFIQIFDARLINKRAQSAVPHFDRMAVIPLDRALDLLSIFQHKNHKGPAVNLLLKVERLCVRTLPACCCGIPPGVVGEGRRNRGHTGGISPCTQRKLWTYELAWARRAYGRQNRRICSINFALRLCLTRVINPGHWNCRRVGHRLVVKFLCRMQNAALWIYLSRLAENGVYQDRPSPTAKE